MKESDFYNQDVEKIEKMGDPLKINQGLRKHKHQLNVEPNLKNFKETDFASRHQKVKDRVLSILREDKYSRVDDFYLCLLYWVKTGQIQMKVDFKDFQHITKPESISRARRELYTEARTNPQLKYLLENKELLEKRKIEQSNYHDYFQDKNNSKRAKLLK